METAARAAEQAELTDDRTPCTRCGCTRSWPRCSTVTPSWSSMPATSGPTPDGSSTAMCPGHGWTADRSAAWDPGRAMRWPPSWPDRQVVLLQGDGAFGFSGMEWDTLVRHGVAVVSVIGNNGIWGWRSTRWSCCTATRSSQNCGLAPVQRSGHRARRARRTGRQPGRNPSRAPEGVRVGTARGGEHADRPCRRVPAPVKPRPRRGYRKPGRRPPPAPPAASATGSGSCRRQHRQGPVLPYGAGARLGGRDGHR